MKCFYYRVISCIKRQFSKDNWKDIVLTIFTIIGACITLWQFFELILPENFLSNGTIISNIAAKTIDFIKENTILIILIILALAIWKNWKKASVILQIPRSNLEIEIGYFNPFKQDGPVIVSGIDTFEDNINSIIDPNSFYGKTIKTFNDTKKGQRNPNFKKEAYSYLVSKGIKGTEMVETKDKKYPLGTIAEFKIADKNYIVAAFGKITENNSVETSLNDYGIFLSNLWSNMSKNVSKYDVINIPIWGSYKGHYPATFTDIQKLNKIISYYIASSRNKEVCTKLRICLYGKTQNSISFDDINALVNYYKNIQLQQEAIITPNCGTGLD